MLYKLSFKKRKFEKTLKRSSKLYKLTLLKCVLILRKPLKIF